MKKVNSSYKMIALFIIAISISIPISSSYVIAQVDFSRGVIDVEEPENVDSIFSGYVINDTNASLNFTDVGEKCKEKSDSVSGVAGIMDNGIISMLEKVLSIIYLICTVMSAVDTVLNTVYMVLQCCFPNPFNAIPCAAKEVNMKVWVAVYVPVIEPICCIAQCTWCAGDTSASQGKCFGILGKVFSGAAFANMIPGIVNTPAQGGGTEKAPAGITQFHLSPYENIYTAIGCMCPGGILFNLRKLNTIYKTYDCCIEQACENGMSTDSCDRMLSEATCMFWEGSLYKTLIKVLISILAGILAGKLLEVIGTTALGAALQCPLAIWNLANTPGTIAGVMAAWNWVDVSFKEPSCEDLGFDKIEKSQESGYGSAEDGLSKLTLNDMDGDGVYDNINQNYDVRKLKDTEKTSLNQDIFGEYAKKSMSEYTIREEVDGEVKETTYYKVNDGFLKTKIVTEAGVEVPSAEWKKTKSGSVAAPTGFGNFAGGLAYYNGGYKNYEFSGENIVMTGDDGEPETVPISELAGKSVMLGGESLKGSEWDKDKKEFVWKTDGDVTKSLTVFDTMDEVTIFAKNENELDSRIAQFNDGNIAEYSEDSKTWNIDGVDVSVADERDLVIAKKIISVVKNSKQNIPADATFSSEELNYGDKTASIVSGSGDDSIIKVIDGTQTEYSFKDSKGGIVTINSFDIPTDNKETFVLAMKELGVDDSFSFDLDSLAKGEYTSGDRTFEETNDGIKITKKDSSGEIIETVQKNSESITTSSGIGDSQVVEVKGTVSGLIESKTIGTNTIITYDKETTVSIKGEDYTYDSKAKEFKKDGATKAIAKGDTDYIALKGIEEELNKGLNANKKAGAKGTTPAERMIKEQQMKDLQAQQVYTLTWELLNGILGEFAYGYIDGMCKEDDPSEESAIVEESNESTTE